MLLHGTAEILTDVAKQMIVRQHGNVFSDGLQATISLDNEDFDGNGKFLCLLAT